MSGNDDERGERSEDHRRVVQRAGAQLSGLLENGLAPGLYVVATPIGNLGDISLRAIAALASADILLCEDTRRAKKLLSHFGISRKVEVYEEHSAARVRPGLIERLRQGASLALISEAGTPLISDPGFKLVREAIEAGIPVFSLPGPVAAITAITASGLPTDRFLFAGFLPAKSAARRKALSRLGLVDATIVVYESAARLLSSLRDIEDIMGPREVCVMRELTKHYEERLSGTARELQDVLAGRTIKGEVVIVVGAAPSRQISDSEIRRHLEEAMASMSARDAVRMVAENLGVQRKRVYKLALGS